MKLDVHKCDHCHVVFDYDNEKDSYPITTHNEVLSQLQLMLGTQDRWVTDAGYVHKFDLCPNCLKSVLEMLNIPYETTEDSYD